MPRLPPALFRQARAEHPHLSKLLAACRDIGTARNELRWLREHAVKLAEARTRGDALNRGNHGGTFARDLQLHARSLCEKLVQHRSKGVPLQYVMGSEFFGELELICRPGVLIPRPDTAAAMNYMVHRLKSSQISTSPQTPQILDLCTGSGCIPLLFQHTFLQGTGHDRRLHLTGVDISAKALTLAEDNRQRQLAIESSKVASSPALIESLQNTSFIRGSVLDPTALLQQLHEHGFDRCDVLLSNPPYISHSEFANTTAHSVRKFEPKLALVPSEPRVVRGSSGIASTQGRETDVSGDVFYPKLIAIAERLQARVVWFEVSNIEQALRVAHMMKNRTKRQKCHVEIWREDLPDQYSQHRIRDTEERLDSFIIRGSGNGRSVAWWPGEEERPCVS